MHLRLQEVVSRYLTGHRCVISSSNEMTDTALREGILVLVKLTKQRTIQIRRKCTEQWCVKLKRLTGKRLEKWLKYIVWWAPLRAIATAYSRGSLNGQRVLICVFEELQRRGLEDAPCIRGIADEIRGK